MTTVVNVFVKQAKQVPLLFVIMLGEKKDYQRVFTQLMEILPSPPAVNKITIDFEKAIWAAI